MLMLKYALIAQIYMQTLSITTFNTLIFFFEYATSIEPMMWIWGGTTSACLANDRVFRETCSKTVIIFAIQFEIAVKQTKVIHFQWELVMSNSNN